MRHLIAAATAAAALAVAGTADAAWIGSWGASPEPPTVATPGVAPTGRFRASPSFENQTVRQIVRVSAGGKQVRVRLTNAFGTKRLRIGAATIGVSDGKGGVVPGTARIITFGMGSSRAVIPAGAPLVSDPVDMAVAPLASLAISLYLPDATGPCTCHSTGMQNAYVATGDHTADAVMPADATTIGARTFLSGVEVDAAPGAKVIVALGDSITDGVGSTSGANKRWPDLLADRLAKVRGSFAVVNHGISGNRVLNPQAAEPALARFDRDVLSVPGVTHVIVFEGVNDLGRSVDVASNATLFGPPDRLSADDMIAGYRQLIARAHAAGLKIIGATIAPYQGASYWQPEGEFKREQINNWIRTWGEFDGVIDFDAAFRDPAKPTQMKDGFHAGDHLHGSDAGYQAAADAIDLGLFTK